jgi:hypothetical protein
MMKIVPECLSRSGEEKKAVAYFKEALEGGRIQVAIHEIDAYVSFPGASKLEVLYPESRTEESGHRVRCPFARV